MSVHPYCIAGGLSAVGTFPPLALTRAAALVGSIQRLTVGNLCAQTLVTAEGLEVGQEAGTATLL